MQLAAELHLAIALLKGYAKYDEETGQADDAAFTRMHIERLEAALPAEWRDEDHSRDERAMGLV
jgi:hypothetical protein